SARNEPGSRELMPTTLKGPRRSVAPGNDHESATRCVHNSLLVEPGLRHGGARRVRSAGRPASTAFMGNGVAAGGGPGARRPPCSGSGAGQSAALTAEPRTSPAARGGGGRSRETPGASAGRSGGRGVLPLLDDAELGAEPHDRVVLAAHDPLLHRDQRVVGDLDVLGADLGAALGDVAETETVVVLRDVAPVGLVRRVHLQLGDPHQEARAGEALLVLVVVTDDVAHVLAEEALDALAELLRALHVHLLHARL